MSGNDEYLEEMKKIGEPKEVCKFDMYKISEEKITGTTERTIIVEAEFCCPHCKAPIYLKVDQEF